MQANQQLQFLQQKIEDLNSAIFFNLSDAVLKFPSSVVSSLNVDDYGYVWFFVKKPKQHVNEFESEFPVRLDFYKKGKSYFLQVSGKAYVVSDPELVNGFVTLPDDAKNAALRDMVLVKVKMLKAEYQETQTTTNSSWWQNAVNSITAWFRNGSYEPNTYYPHLNV
jgi:hypothetical protein